jgi:clathrin heavy chain
MQSDTFICALNQVGDRKQMNIIRLENPERPLRLKISADSAIMHPTSLIVAVRGKEYLNLNNKL